MDQEGKRLRTEAGFVALEQPGSVEEFETWSKLPIRCMQWIQSLLTVPELVYLDTASCGHKSRKLLLDAYSYGFGLRSEAADAWYYDSVRSLRWMMKRGVCLHDFVLELSQASAAANQKNSRRTMMQPEHAVAREWPTFHWLACYGLSPQEDYGDVVSLMAAAGSRSCLEKTDNNGWTALHLACDMGDHHLVRLLVGRGDLRLDVLSRAARPRDRPSTALEHAVVWGSPECLKALLAGGAAIPPGILDVAVKRAGNGRLMDSMDRNSGRGRHVGATVPSASELRLWEQQRVLFPRSKYVLDKMGEQQSYWYDFATTGDDKPHAAGTNRHLTAGLCVEIVRIVLSAADQPAALALMRENNSDNRTACEEAHLIGTTTVVDALEEAETAALAAAETEAGGSMLLEPEQLAVFVDEEVAVSALLSMFAI